MRQSEPQRWHVTSFGRGAQWLAVVLASGWVMGTYGGAIAVAQSQPQSPPPEADTQSETKPAAPRSPQLGRIVGQVVNQSGQPIAQATVRVRGSRTGGVPVGLFDRTVQTDDSGSFELDSGLPGRWQLSVAHPDYNPLNNEVWFYAGLTTPLDITLTIPIEPQPRTRLGVIGVGTLAHTEFLSQRLASETVRMGLVPNDGRLLAIDNRNLQPVLERIGRPLFDILEHDEIEPEAVNQFFDFLGLEALVVARVDVLSSSVSEEEIALKSRSRLELWTIDDRGEVLVKNLDSEDYEETETSAITAADIEQLYQVQVTRMATEVSERWEDNNPLARFFEEQPEDPPPAPRTIIDTTVELAIPEAGVSPEGDTPAFPAPVSEQ